MHWNAVTLFHNFGKVKALSLTLSSSPLYSVWRIFGVCLLSSGGCTYRETVMIQQFFIVTFHHNSVISTRPDKFYTHFPKLSLKAHLMSPQGVLQQNHGRPGLPLLRFLRLNTSKKKHYPRKRNQNTPGPSRPVFRSLLCVL